jgi:hypothetical protein
MTAILVVLMCNEQFVLFISRCKQPTFKQEAEEGLLFIRFKEAPKFISKQHQLTLINSYFHHQGST